MTIPCGDETGARACIDEMKWDGRIYNITGKSHDLGVMFYNKRLVEQTGLEDPAELQARGEWAWDTFKQYLEETTLDTDGDGGDRCIRPGEHRRFPHRAVQQYRRNPH